jgi:hypothetical protein
MVVRMFDSPVYVKTGNLIVEEIACLEDALEFLYDWPAEPRDMICQNALEACHRVVERGHPLRAARQALVEFAKSSGILENLDTLPSWIALSKIGGGATT